MSKDGFVDAFGLAGSYISEYLEECAKKDIDFDTAVASLQYMVDLVIIKGSKEVK